MSSLQTEFNETVKKENLVTVSVIIISRNEEKNISKCLDSVLSGVSGVNNEIILVDSASTDNTVEIAMSYPIIILQLKPEWLLSAAAGRYIGTIYSKGKYLLFLDGDTILEPDWLQYAIPYIDNHSDVGGIVGTFTEEKYDNIMAKKANIISDIQNNEIGEIDNYGGNILLRSEVLRQVGSFNPYLKAMEEGELIYRILDGGYKLVRIPEKMFHHIGLSNESYFTLLRRMKVSAISSGQIFRYSLHNKRIFYMHLSDNKYIFLFSIYILLGILSILVSLINLYIILIWLIGALVLIAYMIYERSIASAFSHIVGILIRLPYFIWGFLCRPKSIDSYPLDIKIISKNKYRL